jgi:putative ABC transport system permease protein
MTAQDIGMGHIWREALAELWRRKLRTGLTLLGLIFGVGAIVAMQGVGEGSRLEALALVEELGLRNLIVRAKSQDNDALKEMRLRSLGLTRADARAALEAVPGAERSPPRRRSARIRSTAMSAAATCRRAQWTRLSSSWRA